MRTYTELVTEFAWKNAVAKQKMIDDSSIEELKILRYGLELNMSTGKGADDFVVDMQRTREERLNPTTNGYYHYTEK
jgi:hypothetical protein